MILSQHHCWVTASLYSVVGIFMIITDIAKCQAVAQKMAIYQSFKGRSVVHLFVSLPLLSTYDGDFNHTISDPLQSAQDIPVVVGLILFINSIIFLLLSFCPNGSFPKRGAIAAMSGDPDFDFPTGFEIEKATAFDGAVEMHKLHRELPENQILS